MTKGGEYRISEQQKTDKMQGYSVRLTGKHHPDTRGGSHKSRKEAGGSHNATTQTAHGHGASIRR